MGSEAGGLGFIPPGNEHLAQLNSGLSSSRERRRVLSLYLNSLRYSLGVQPVFLRKATLNELV
jgi:hypothetical protein